MTEIQDSYWVLEILSSDSSWQRVKAPDTFEHTRGVERESIKTKGKKATFFLGLTS